MVRLRVRGRLGEAGRACDGLRSCLLGTGLLNAHGGDPCECCERRCLCHGMCGLCVKEGVKRQGRVRCTVREVL